MNNYKIIQDINELTKFIDWLPELLNNEIFYCSLFARKKYCQELIKSNHSNQLKRFTSDKRYLIKKLRSLELPFGNYTTKGDNIAPQEALAAYILPNPRNVHQASFRSIEKLSKMLSIHNNNFNPITQVMSCIQKTKSRSVVVDFDFDDKDKNIIKECTMIVNEEALTVVETRGGYHVLVKPKLVTQNEKNWYKLIKDLGADESGDIMLPIPGCVQGDFVPRIVKL